MYYGNAAATEPAIDSTYGSEKVWDSDYVMVQHLQETSGTQYDSTSNDNDGTYSYNATYGDFQGVDSKIDGGDGYYGYTGYSVTVANSTSLDMGSTFTASLWAEYTDEVAPNNYERMLTRKGAYDAENGWEFSLENDDDDALTVRGSSSAGTAGAQGVVTSWAAGGWHHIVVVYNGTTATVYCDGTQKDTVTIASVVDNDLPLYMGRYGESDANNWVGYLDEVRLSGIARSANWIKTCYTNQNDPAAFRTLGSETRNWESYSDSGRETQEDTFSTYGNYVYMKGEGFDTTGTYKVAYYDGDSDHDGSTGAKVETDSYTDDADGTLNSECRPGDYLASNYGTWHAVVYKTTESMPATYDLVDSGNAAYTVEDSFTVESTAIPEFPTMMAAIGVAGLCFGIYYWMRKRVKFKGQR